MILSKEDQIKELTNKLLFNYDMPNEFAEGLAEFLYDEDYRKKVKGKWILNHGIIDYYTCSHCGSMISQSQLNRFYCPRCGAKMEIEEKN